MKREREIENMIYCFIDTLLDEKDYPIFQLFQCNAMTQKNINCDDAINKFAKIKKTQRN